jgi:hypothetical protein
MYHCKPKKFKGVLSVNKGTGLENDDPVFETSWMANKEEVQNIIQKEYRRLKPSRRYDSLRVTMFSKEEKVDFVGL